MSTPNTFSYDCRQPDPEIWGGGTTTSLFTITSGSEYSEKVFYNYDLEVAPGSSATGLLTITGVSVSESLIKDYIGEVSTYLISNSGVERAVYVPPIFGPNINIFGSSNYSFISSEIGQQISIDYSGFIIERVTYDYNRDSTVVFSIVDDGLITSSPTLNESYGLLIDSAQEHIDCGSTEILSTTTALSGGFILSNSATYKHISVDVLGISPIVLSSYAEERVNYDPPINEKLTQSPDITLNGSGSYFVVYNTPEDTVDLVSTISSIEKVGHSYNDSSLGAFETETYSTINDPVTSSIDYGLISLTPTQGNEDYGFTFDTNSTTLPYGTITVSGSATVRPPDDIRTYNAGATYRVSYNPPENTSSLFTFGEKSESIAYEYNIDSINVVLSESIGLLTDSPTSIEDSGLITEIITEFVDYEGIDIATTNFPFGSLNIGGSANVEYTNKNFYDNIVSSKVRVVYSPDDTTGTLFNFGNIEESITYEYNINSSIEYTTDNFGSINNVISYDSNLYTFDNTQTLINDLIPPDDYDDYGILTGIPLGIEDYLTIEITEPNNPFGSLVISGSANAEHTNKNFYDNVVSSKVRVVYSPDDTTGSLFSFGERIESIVYDYNNDSILFITDPDYGFISSSPTNSESYELISNAASISDDFGTILGPSISTDTYPFGSLYISGISVEKNSENYVSDTSGSQISIFGTSSNLHFIAQPTEDVVLYNLSGSAGITPVCYSEVGSGSLFGIGEKLESVTYDYNDLSVNLLETENSGLVSDPSTSVDDYGLISNPVSEQEVYGEVDLTSTVTPFGTISITGNADVTYRNANFYDYPVTSIVRVAYSPDDTAGTLFTFGEKLESVTYDYSNESLLIFAIDDLGLLSDPVTNVDDYGFVNEVYGEQIDNGLDTGLGESQTIIPFGSFTISGTSGNVLRTYGEENTVLFAISGSLNHPNVDYTPAITGIGTAFISGSATHAFIERDIATQIPTILINESLIESRTHSYNESSILTDVDVAPNYGLISNPLSESIDDYGSLIGSSGETNDYGFITVGVQSAYPFGSITISGTPLVHPEVDYTPSYTGTGTFNVSGSTTYSETNAFGVGRRRGGTINLCGDALYSETDAYVGVGTIVLDQEGIVTPALIARTRSYVGIETIILSDSGLESRTIFIPTSGIGTGFIGGLIAILGSATESYSAQTPEDTQLFTFSGELNHPQIDYTPHYGIEKNIGIGTTGIQISGVVDDAANRTARGQGSIFIQNGFSPQDTEAYPGGPGVGRSWSFTRTTYIAQPISINISTGVALTNYYSPIYPRNALVTDPSSGIGTIRINDDRGLTLYRATLPYNARGTIFLSGIGPESFTPQTEIGSGQFTLSGIASTREIAVYQGYETSGTIVISQQTQPIIEKNTESYVGLGTVFISEFVIESNVDSYSGTGTLFTLDGSSEVYSAQTPEETITITVSGSAEESFIAQTPENTILYQFSGAATDEKLTKSYDGSGLTIVSGSANVNFSPLYPASGTFRFVKYTSDQIYDTCDSVDATSDYLNSASVSFVANPPEDTILFNISGNAITSETALYTETSVGLYTLFGTYESSKLIRSESGIGTVFITSTSPQSETDVYVGTGTLFTLSGSSEVYSAQTPESTILLQISGSAVTSVEFEYSIAGIGLFSFNGSANTSEIASYTQIGSGNIILSGQLVYPDIIFIPSPDGSGIINILGSADESLTKIYETTGTLFNFSSGFESFTKSTYIGIGTIYTEQVSGITINNPYQIPRVYVSII